MFARPASELSLLPTVLVVCTGNICRSPLAEALLRTRFAGSGLRVHSAGTHALPGVPMTDPAQQVARARGFLRHSPPSTVPACSPSRSSMTPT